MKFLVNAIATAWKLSEAMELKMYLLPTLLPHLTELQQISEVEQKFFTFLTLFDLECIVVK